MKSLGSEVLLRHSLKNSTRPGLVSPGQGAQGIEGAVFSGLQWPLT